MKLTIAEGRELTEAALTAASYTTAEAAAITDHLIDCELRGLGYGGMARGLSVIDRLLASDAPSRPITLVRETPFSASFDGGDQVGYLVANRVTETAIVKARATGIAVVGAYETWYTGMFSYYLEKITAAGFVGMIAGSGGAIVAPEGGTEGRFGTNPIAFGFPTNDLPIIWDIGTSSITFAEVILQMRTGGALAEGVAYNAAGNPTVTPAEALMGGAFRVWGGHRGSGLAMVVQLLGMLCGAAAAPDGLRDCGFFMMVVDPGALTSADDYRQRVSDFSARLRATRPLDKGQPVRVPFERSAAVRAARLRDDVIEISDEVYRLLKARVDGANTGG